MSYFIDGVRVERRVAVDDGELGINVYPIQKGQSADDWLDQRAPLPAARARIERRITVSFSLPWVPGRWVSGWWPPVQLVPRR